MRAACLIVFLLSQIISYSQNLVPNGNFENNTNGLVSDWIQPRGDYYHYQTFLENKNNTTRYNSENGLCLLNISPSEYLVVKLKRKLTKDENYCIRIDIRIIQAFRGNIEDLKTVEMAFSDMEPVIHNRTNLFMTPDVVLKIDQSKPYMDFQTIEEKYTARGDEQYLVIGKFFAAETDSAFNAQKLSIVELREEMLMHKKLIQDSFFNRYASYASLATINKPKKKKERKIMDDSVLSLWNLKKEALIENELMYNEMIAHTDKYQAGIGYQIRTHFDNICVAPEVENNTCTCEENIESASFESGRSYMLQNVHFDLDKATLTLSSFEQLNNLVNVLNQYPKMWIQINGHTDSINSEAYNLELSSRRAKTVADYLMSNGIAAQRLTWKGFGESMPLTNNRTEEGRAMNRRVEFIVIKK